MLWLGSNNQTVRICVLTHLIPLNNSPTTSAAVTKHTIFNILYSFNNNKISVNYFCLKRSQILFMIVKLLYYT